MNIKKLMVLLSIVISITMLSSGLVFASSSNTVKIDPSKSIAVTGGKITGTLSSDKKVAIYKGIPFAASPVGELRWKAPQSVQAWSGVKKCTTFSANAMQAPSDKSQPWMACYTDEFLVDNALKFSEDCLYLNVWTKASSAVKNRPVIVYIHGGGYGSGSGSIPVYDGEAIANKDAIYVTINYRVGIFGFLADSKLSVESKDGVSGNYGILDQIAALKWIQNNIAKFGGDPSNVTIIGQSAGAGSVDILTISPDAKGLFKNAVALSYNYVSNNMNIISMKDKEATDADLFKGKTLKEMRAVSAEDLLKLTFSPTPCVDGKIVPGNFADILKKGSDNNVNMISGNVTGDTGLFGTISIGNPWVALTTLSKADYEKGVSDTFGDLAKECLAAYPVTGDDALGQYQQINLDGMMASQYYLAKLRALNSDNATYIFSFDRSLPGKGDFGAFHTADVPYWLGSFASDRDQYLTKTDYSVSKSMVSYLVNFAKTGNPNGKGLANWEAYDGSMTDLYIGDNVFATEGFSHQKNLFWQDYYNSILGLK